MRKLRIALIGCGQIADAHLAEVRKIGCAEIVAVCDTHRDLAAQAAARFDVPHVYDSLDRLLGDQVADVVHITTPVHTHCPLAVKSLQSGLHVYLEKPFTVNALEADLVLQAAQDAGRLVCVGHNLLFDPVWLACRHLIASGELGDVVHVESIHGYDLSGPFGRLVASDPNHWVNRLPGGLVQNVVSHPLYRITDFLPDAQPDITATWKEDLCAPNPFCEVRAILQGKRVTGTLVFTSCTRPLVQLTRVYGSRQSVEVDLEARVVRRYRPARTRGPFVKLELPFAHMREACGNFAHNLWRFFRSDLHYFAGMKNLFTEFYQAILRDGPPPIAYRDVRRITAIMDEIFTFRPSTGHETGGIAEESAAPRATASSRPSQPI